MKKIRFVALLAGLVLLSSLGGNAVWAKNWNLSNDPQSADQNIGVELFGTLGMANFEAVEDRYIKQPHDTLNISDVTLFMVTSDILRDGKGQDNEVRYYRGDRCPPLMVTPAYEMAGKPNIVWFYEEFKNEEKLEDIINLFVNDIGYQACMHMGSSNNYEDGQHKKDQLRFFYKKCPNGLTSLANIGNIKFCLDKFNASKNKVLETQSSTSSTTSTPSKADKSKAFCKDIGFTAGTEKFGECVLKMMDK